MPPHTLRGRGLCSCARFGLSSGCVLGIRGVCGHDPCTTLPMAPVVSANALRCARTACAAAVLLCVLCPVLGAWQPWQLVSPGVWTHL